MRISFSGPACGCTALACPDGTVVYDTAFALVWVEDGDAALNTNEAFAFASCTSCAAVSIAFQVVLVVGDNDTAVPQNLAGAVNFDCVNCLTYALAQQLFVTLDGPLSPEAMAALDALWAEIAAYGANIDEVPLSEIAGQLDAFESEILAIIEADQPGTLPSTSPSASASPSASELLSPTASAEPSPTASSTTTLTATSTGTPAPSPTATAPTTAPTTAGESSFAPTAEPSPTDPALSVDASPTG